MAHLTDDKAVSKMGLRSVQALVYRPLKIGVVPISTGNRKVIDCDDLIESWAHHR
jgi:hypothetical protein